MTALAAAVFGVALAATLSRSGWLGLLAALVVVAILARRRRLRLAVIVGSLAAALVLGGLVGPMATRLAPNESGSPLDELASRFHVWVAAVSIWAEHPLFGVGVADFVNYYQQQPDADVIGHAHNIFLNMAVERGVLGFLTFVTVLVALFRTLAHSLGAAADTIRNAAAVGLMATFAGYLVHSLLEVSYYDYKVLLLFWLLAGVGAALSNCEGPHDLVAHRSQQ
jgi:putative inorganic carbon (HCO3(-)) transporter